MRFGMIGDNPIEKAALASGLLPTPMLEGYAMVTTRALLVAARVGLFEAIGGGTATAGELSARCGTYPRATEGASTVRRTALLLVLAVSVLAGVAALGMIRYELFGTLFGIRSQGSVSVPLGALIVAVAVAAYHGQLLRNDDTARHAVAAPPAPGHGLPAELPLVLVAPAGTDPAELARVRRAIEEHLPDGYRLRDVGRMS